MGKGKKLAIFDLDGTLFDTKDVNFRAYSKAIQECGYQADIDYKYYCDFCNGNNYKTFLPVLIPKITPQGMQAIHDAKKRLYASYLKYAVKNKSLFSLIESIRGEYVIALATTASRENVDDILKEFRVAEEFDIIITQEDVINCKPAPECFLLAMERSGVMAENTIIFEDSETGLKAAEASGADYVRVYGYN